MYIPRTRSPRIKITIPNMSNRRQKFSTRWEWFTKVWYTADNDRHKAAANIKMERVIKSALVTPEYLLVRCCWI